MGYKEKYTLKFFEYDDEFSLIGIFDDYESLQVKYSKYEAHELNITVNRNIPNTDFFQEGRFVQLGNVSDCLFIITTVKESIDENGKGGNYLNIQARDCRYLFKRRIIMTINDVETWTETGTAETVLRHLISSQTEGKRSLPINNVIPDNPVGEQISLSEAKTNLYDVVCNYCQQGNIGWKVNFDGYVLTLVFFPVTDISSLVKFTVDYESLKNGEFEDSSENYKNVVYVGGKGSGNNQAIYEAEDEIEGGSPSGIDRIETWISEGSLTTEDELQKVGESKLIEFSQKLNFTGNGLEKSPFEFRVHYDIGNIVEVAFGDRSANVEIISIQESWAYNEYDMQFEFGKPLNYLSNQVKKIYNLLQKYNSTDAKTNSEIKYYTIPTDTEQPIGDVGLDVIGFIGNTGDANKTFTLFFSADGTGAKTYHVYFKQLSGTGKLILTTGVQGTEQLEFSTGTYVAIIYVDENGNVKNSFGISDNITSSQTAWSGEKTQTEINDVRGDIPTKTSELNNDSGFITKSQLESLPTDAILHYSFDEVPDLPDGSADYRRNGDWTDTGGFYSQVVTDFSISNSNGKIKITRNSSYYGANIYNIIPNLLGKIVKMSITVNNVVAAPSISVFTYTDYPHYILPNTPMIKGKTYYIEGVVQATSNDALYISMPDDYEQDITVNYLYVGDGSYNTPIIDNSYGGHNATNNGALATKGVCGKGIKFLGNKAIAVNNILKNDSIYSLSLWLKGDTTQKAVCGTRDGSYTNSFSISNNYVWHLNGNPQQEVGVHFGNTDDWTHLVAVFNNGTLDCYKNGEFIGTVNYINNTPMDMDFIWIGNHWNLDIKYYDGEIDDFQIFDRALSEAEIKALYLNRANTPKFYNRADWWIDNHTN